MALLLFAEALGSRVFHLRTLAQSFTFEENCKESITLTTKLACASPFQIYQAALCGVVRIEPCMAFASLEDMDV